jgi:VanZ family protein
MLREQINEFSMLLSAWLFWPALALVVWGELAAPSLGPFHVWDKLLHVVAYFGLALLASLALGGGRRALWAALALVAVGGGLELVQGLIGRDMSLYDEIANILGVLAGVASAWGYSAVLTPRRLVDARGPD